MHPLITIFLWEVHNDDRNMLSKFHLNLLCRLGEMVKTSSGSVTMQQQQLERAELNVETIACSSDPARGHLHKNKTTMNHQSSDHATTSTCMQQIKINTCMQHNSHLTSGT